MAEIIGSLFKNKQLSKTTSSDVGQYGENVASNYLKRRGYQIAVKNFRAPIGRNSKGVQVTGEIDIIAVENDTICFIEVKTRSSDYFVSPLSAVDVRKQRQITRVARVYRNTFDLLGSKGRFDVVSIVLNGKRAPGIELIRGFWSEKKFRKKRWSDDYLQNLARSQPDQKSSFQTKW